MYGAIEVVRCISIFHTSLKRGCHSDRITLIYDLRSMSCLDNRKSLIENGLHQLLSLDPCVSLRLHLGHLLYQEVFWSNILGCVVRNSFMLAFFFYFKTANIAWKNSDNAWNISSEPSNCYERSVIKKYKIKI